MKYKLKGIDWFLIIFLLIVVVLTPIILLNEDIGEIFNAANWFASENYAEFEYWSAIGFLIIVSILGALIPIPIPYIMPAFLFAGAWYENDPMWLLKVIGMIFFAALGNAAGDFLDYLIGKGAGHVMSKDQPENTDRWGQIIMKYPKAIPYVISLFGLTPLPDSLLLVPLGIVKYPIKKTLLYMYIGKIGMFLIVAIGGILSMDIIAQLLGESGDAGSLIGILLLYFMWLIVAVMAKLPMGGKKKSDSESTE